MLRRTVMLVANADSLATSTMIFKLSGILEMYKQWEKHRALRIRDDRIQAMNKI